MTREEIIQSYFDNGKLEFIENKSNGSAVVCHANKMHCPSCVLSEQKGVFTICYIDSEILKLYPEYFI